MRPACPTAHRAPAAPRGFTLVESALAVAIAGILLVASLTVMAAVAKQRWVQAERRTAFALNQQLMGEVLSQYFYDPSHTSFGPTAGQVRSTFASVDDYNGYTESPPAFQNGTTMTDYAGWKRSVSVQCVDPNNPLNALAGSTLKQVTITVTAPSGKSYSLTGMRSLYGVYEYLPQTNIRYVTQMSVSLQASTQVKTIRSSARPLNITTSQ